MFNALKQLDDLLRGHKTAPDQLARGDVDLPLWVFAPLAVALGATYGFFMGWYAVVTREPATWMQVLAAMIKLPALFLLTLVVTAPSLYVFSTLAGSRLRMASALRLLVAAIVVNLAVAASLGPILGFFTFSTTSYSFMIILNVLLMTIAGTVGLVFLLHTLRRLVDRPVDTAEQPDEAPGPIEPLNTSERALGQAGFIFRVWVVIYALVGAQMGWLLRPFIGTPDIPFTWFRERYSNFFESVLIHIRHLIND